MSNAEKLIIMVAPTGHLEVGQDSPLNPPITPEEVAEEAFKCYEVGASIAHVHVRDEKTKFVSGNIGAYSESITRIRGKCDMLIQITGGIGSWRDPVTNKRIWASDEQRMALFDVRPKPDLIPVAMGTSDYIYPDGYSTYFNTPDYLKKFIPAIIKNKLGWEMEIFDVSFLYNALRMANEGVFDRHMPLLMTYVMGMDRGFQPATSRQVAYIIEEGRRVFPQAKWTVGLRERNYYQIQALAISMGCHLVRVGFEDCYYLPNGEIAKNNVQLVESVIRIAKDLGREIATVKEAREILSLPK